MLFTVFKDLQIILVHRYIFWVSVCAYAGRALHADLGKADLHIELPSYASTLLLPVELWSALPPFPSLSLLSLSPPPDCGRQASRADGILASRMTLVFLPLVLILQSWLSKPNPTLARAAGPMPALLLSTQRLFITARVLASSSTYTHYPCATRLLSSILILSSLPILLLTNLLYTQEYSVSTTSPSPPLPFLHFLFSLLRNRHSISLSSLLQFVL